MRPLIDGDILLHEISSCGQYAVPHPTGWKEEEELRVRNFDFVSDLFDQSVDQICEEVWADEQPIIFLSNCVELNKMWNRAYPDQKIDFKPNFREVIAVTRPYKGNRKGKVKPVHFYNLMAYVMVNYDVRIANGMEADDLLSIYQTTGIRQEKETIICSRDKDLRITPGWHYGWACGRQLSTPPHYVDEIGKLDLVLKGGKKQIVGNGLKFFYSQVLTGDTTDDYPGLPGCGAVRAYKVLKDCDNERQLITVVGDEYCNKYGNEEWRERLMEQAQLAWMCREWKDKEPVLWRWPDA